MTEANDALWEAFEALAKKYPHDDGVRMTADLARWLLAEHQRAKLPAPPILKKAIRAVTQYSNAPRPPNGLADHLD
jgi:hypothetical protein